MVRSTFTVIPTAADGNCLFYAIFYAITNNPNHVTDIIQAKILNYYETYKSLRESPVTSKSVYYTAYALRGLVAWYYCYAMTEASDQDDVTMGIKLLEMRRNALELYRAMGGDDEEMARQLRYLFLARDRNGTIDNKKLFRVIMEWQSPPYWGDDNAVAALSQFLGIPIFVSTGTSIQTPAARYDDDQPCVVLILRDAHYAPLVKKTRDRYQGLLTVGDVRYLRSQPELLASLHEILHQTVGYTKFPCVLSYMNISVSSMLDENVYRVCKQENCNMVMKFFLNPDDIYEEAYFLHRAAGVGASPRVHLQEQCKNRQGKPFTYLLMEDVGDTSLEKYLQDFEHFLNSHVTDDKTYADVKDDFAIWAEKCPILSTVVAGAYRQYRVLANVDPPILQNGLTARNIVFNLDDPERSVKLVNFSRATEAARQEVDTNIRTQFAAFNKELTSNDFLPDDCIHALQRIYHNAT